jgi:hypothetical protein
VLFLMILASISLTQQLCLLVCILGGIARLPAGSCRWSLILGMVGVPPGDRARARRSFPRHVPTLNVTGDLAAAVVISGQAVRTGLIDCRTVGPWALTRRSLRSAPSSTSSSPTRSSASSSVPPT